LPAGLWPLLIGGESVALRRIVGAGAAGSRRPGRLTSAGLVCAMTVSWIFVLFLIALSQPDAFTF
jgi:hypothetical protein